MPSISSSVQQLRGASGLVGLLNAVRLAFEVMLAEIQARQDPASPMFAAFMMAAVSAADGRDAVCFAPSLLTHPPGPPGQDTEAGESAEQVTAMLVSLCVDVEVRLDLAAGSAADPGDRQACQDAARCAREIRDLLAGTSQ